MTDDQMQELIAQIPKIAKRIGRMVDHKLPEFDDLQSEIICDSLKFIRSGNFRGDASVGTVVYTIMRRRVFDHYRRNYKNFNGHEYMTLMEPQPVPAHVKLDAQRKIDFALSHLLELPPRKREIITKIYCDGVSIRDAAADMEIDERTAKHYLQSGLAQLRRIVLAHWRDKSNEGATNEHQDCI